MATASDSPDFLGLPRTVKVLGKGFPTRLGGHFVPFDRSWTRFAFYARRGNKHAANANSLLKGLWSLRGKPWIGAGPLGLGTRARQKLNFI